MKLKLFATLFCGSVACGSMTLSTPLAAQDVAYPPLQNVIAPHASEEMPPPRCAAIPEYNSGTPVRCTAADAAEYLTDLRHWRHEERIRMGLQPDQYNVEALRWTQSSYIQPQMMVHDRYFFDPVAGRYTVDRYLADVKTRYGGIDSVLIWPTYPNIGVDDRNQYDLFHDLPGGTGGIKQMVAAFQHQGVRVLFPVMAWDQGTRPEGKPDPVAMSEELVEVGADGINGDTLEGFPRTFREASDTLHHPLALEPELWLGADEMVNFNNMSWGYWNYQFMPSDSTFAPTVSRYKWLEPKHMVNLSDRWAHNHNDDLQHAFFNGIGFESWENIWGIWNGITPRDSEALRRVAKIERATNAFLLSPDWEPHVATINYGVFASRWPKQRETVWTLVNRNPYPVHGTQLEIPVKADARYYDLWNGIELKPAVENGKATLTFEMEANGFGAVLETDELSASMQELMRSMKILAEKPLSAYDAVWKTLPQTLVAIDHSKPGHLGTEEMVRLPKANFRFRVLGIEIEGRNDEGTDVQYPWEPSARRYHDARVDIGDLWIDKYPVTNRQFKAFVDASHYKPSDSHNFLRDWHNGSYPAGWANKPVTWVSIEDARAYAQWAGKRLPHEWEWQYAAQGTDGRVYPWGSAPAPTGDAPARPIPVTDTGRTMQPAADVAAHPAGASPFGVMDLVGNVWQWTDEYQDEHTRAAIVRGGSHYSPQGARWYFPQAYQNDQHSKYLLMAPSLDRSGAIGFRCVKDAS